MTSDWGKLDDIMKTYSPRLRDDFHFSTDTSNALASTISSEILSLPTDELRPIYDEDAIGLYRRLEELWAFERFMDLTHGARDPAVTRATVISQLYVVFVYLGDSCFTRLKKVAKQKSTVRKCCQFLTEGHVRGLRNAVAHSNWRYGNDFQSLVIYYWQDEQKTRWIEYEVSQLDLDFWDKLARITAYVAFQTINEMFKE